MKCDQIKEFLMTDYTDGELSNERKKEIEDHLNNCCSCKEFEQALRKVAIDPFKNIEEVKPPDYVWERVKNSIDHSKEQDQIDIVPGIRGFFSSIFAPRRAVFTAIPAVVIIFLAIFLTRTHLNNKIMVNTYLNEQAEFFAYLDNEVNGGSVDLGTDIEKYLL